MGNDSSIVQAARVSYGTDNREHEQAATSLGKESFACLDGGDPKVQQAFGKAKQEIAAKDRNLIRYLMNHSHSTPFEMVEFKFMVQVPMDCWRQWIRHRTASVNEYSTRYTVALDFFQVTSPQEWRLQATDNKQGSSGYLEEWPEELLGPFAAYPEEAKDFYWMDASKETVNDSLYYSDDAEATPGKVLSELEQDFHEQAMTLYKQRLRLGVAKEQARKDLPLSTYTRAYWKCDLHNIFNFLRLRMDSHAQREIRSFANCMFEIVKEVCPVACGAFEDYVLHAKKFSRMEMAVLRNVYLQFLLDGNEITRNPDRGMTDREWKEFLEKLQ